MSASFCWLCGKPLKHNAAGELISVPHEVEPGRIVLVHKTCKNDPVPEALSMPGVKRKVREYLNPEWVPIREKK